MPYASTEIERMIHLPADAQLEIRNRGSERPQPPAHRSMPGPLVRVRLLDEQLE